MKPQISKKTGAVFSGDLVVLLDSKSASAAELFGRVVQLNHRGALIGDRSSGSVMESRFYPLQQGSDTVIFYGVSVTDADLIMSDGQSLENHGVTPDEIMLPTAADLAEGRDAVLAYAAGKLGTKLTPKAAGELFPFEWTPVKDE
jgi:C-terminal processing protease CtpA/Prc